MSTSLLSVPTPHQTPISTRPSLSNSAWLHLHNSATPIRNPYKSVILLCSSSSSVSVVEEESSPPTDVAVSKESDPPAGVVDNVSFRGCKACGREEVERGCNGEGRIQGGIATVPGFGWWPIKAYRPCPGFVASGGRYRRRGQSMDEVAFGRKEREPLMSTSNGGEAQSSEKPGPKKVKR